MHRALVAALLIAGCGTTAGGQKVTVLLSDRTVTCEPQEDGTSLGHLTLDQPEDLYLAEFTNRETGLVHVLEAHRDGLIVSYTCPDAVDTFLVRHATVLQARQQDNATSDPGGSTAPTN